MNLKINEPNNQEIQHQILRGLLEIKRICEKNNLTFYLIGGTALGAVRHKGFIPWDDDADVGLPREDYEKFIEICKRELDAKFFLQTLESDSNYYLPYAKLRIENTKYVLKTSEKFQMHQGIFVDVFPLDNISSEKIRIFRQKYVADFFIKVRNSKISNPNPGTLKYFIRKIISSMFSLNLVNKIVLNEIMLAQKENSEKMGNLLGLYGFDKEVFKKEIFGKPHYEEFENEMFPIPNQYDKFLTQIYGDYMKIPDEKDRVVHDVVKVEINN